MANSKDRRSENVNVIELYCKVVKKWQPPISASAPVSCLFPLPSKNFHTPSPQVTQLLEGPTLPFNRGVGDGGGGGAGEHPNYVIR